MFILSMMKRAAVGWAKVVYCHSNSLSFIYGRVFSEGKSVAEGWNGGFHNNNNDDDDRKNNNDDDVENNDGMKRAKTFNNIYPALCRFTVRDPSTKNVGGFNRGVPFFACTTCRKLTQNAGTCTDLGSFWQRLEEQGLS